MSYQQCGGVIYREGELIKKKKRIGGRTRNNLMTLGGVRRGANGELIKLSSTCIIFIKRVDSTALGNRLQTLKTYLFSQIVWSP